jgi:hypothetical protein
VQDDKAGEPELLLRLPWSLREKSEAMADNLKTHFQPVTNLSLPVIEMGDVTLRSYFLIPANESKVNNPEEIQEAIRGLRFSKASSPNGIQDRSLKHLPQREVSHLVLIFNMILPTHHFPTSWTYARVFYTNNEKGSSTDLILSAPWSSDTFGKLLEKILLARSHMK